MKTTLASFSLLAIVILSACSKQADDLAVPVTSADTCPAKSQGQCMHENGYGHSILSAYDTAPAKALDLGDGSTPGAWAR